MEVVVTDNNKARESYTWAVTTIGSDDLSLIRAELDQHLKNIDPDQYPYG
ncbi:MAG: hypothetical protein ACLTZU_03910 [Odoribacter splanchnicus]